jgi:hypothetical protein
MYVSFFFVTLVWNILCSDKYTVKMQVKYLLMLSNLKKKWNVLMNVIKSGQYKIHENPFSSSRIVTCGQTDMVKKIGTF